MNTEIFYVAINQTNKPSPSLERTGLRNLLTVVIFLRLHRRHGRTGYAKRHQGLRQTLGIRDRLFAYGMNADIGRWLAVCQRAVGQGRPTFRVRRMGGIHPGRDGLRQKALMDLTHKVTDGHGVPWSHKNDLTGRFFLIIQGA